MKISSISVSKEFHDFGKYIQIVAILTIVSITTGMAGFVALIFIFIAMGSLKKANNALNNLLLHEFRSKYIRSVISRVCGTVVLVVGGVNLGLFFFTSSSYPIIISLSLPIILILSGIVLIYVGVAAEMSAWKHLKLFFMNNTKMFPANISEEAIKGCDKLKQGTLLSSLGFLIVPAIVGFILQVKGYFMLSTLNKLSIDNTPELEFQADLDEPIKPIKSPEKGINFCRNCGAKLSGLGNFCALCGSRIQ